MIRIRHVIFMHNGGTMIHEYRETAVDGVIDIEVLKPGGVWCSMDASTRIGIGKTMDSIINTYTSSGWIVHNDCQTVKPDQGIDFIPISINLDDIKIEKHKCHCDLRGANCWLGCRCGGV